jgi:fatty acid desaturase
MEGSRFGCHDHMVTRTPAHGNEAYLPATPYQAAGPSREGCDMIPGSELMAASEYVRVLRPLLPSRAFEPDARHLFRIGLHLIMIGLGYFTLRVSNSVWLWMPIVFVVGHSLACLLFLAHDVSHNSVVRNTVVKRALELLLWGLNCIPPTLWRRVHNHTHHVETNTLCDTDRKYRLSEQTKAISLYNKCVNPSRTTPLRHPLVLFHFVTWIMRHLWTALLPGSHKPSIVTFKPKYTHAQRAAIVIEMFVIMTFQLIIWHLMGREWLRYVFAVPLPLLVASTVSMSYIFTNHLLNPLCEHSDPLVGSTSVIVPRWLDWLHDNFSYHTEHHVFPGMNPRYYPAVSRLLQKHFPERYNRIPFTEAWQQIWQQEEFISEVRILKVKASPYRGA